LRFWFVLGSALLTKIKAPLINRRSDAKRGDRGFRTAYDRRFSAGSSLATDRSDFTAAVIFFFWWNGDNDREFFAGGQDKKQTPPGKNCRAETIICSHQLF